MRSFALRDIPGVGPALAEALEARGLALVEDLLRVDRSWLEQWFGESRGRWLWERARGLDHARVRPLEPRKSVSSERTFPRDLTDDDALEREILRLATSVGAGLRRAGLRGRTVTVKIRDDDFRTRTAGHTFPVPLESDVTLYQASRAILRELRARRRRGVRLLGVGVSSLVEGGGPLQMHFYFLSYTRQEIFWLLNLLGFHCRFLFSPFTSLLPEAFFPVGDFSVCNCLRFR